MRFRLIFTVLICCVLELPAKGFDFNKTDSLKIPKRHKLVGLPVAFYSPDTKFGGGAAGFYSFLQKNDSTNARRSSFTFGFAFTQLRQTLIYLPYQLYFKNSQYWLYGEIGYYDYIYNYFGTGNQQPDNYLEKYTAAYPRLRISATRKTGKHIYAGIRYAFDEFALRKFDANGELQNGLITGSKGGTISGGGLVFNYDTRDRLFYPGKGILAELVLYGENRFTGSDFKYSRVAFDASFYHTLKWKHNLVFNVYSLSNFGDVPFQQMAMIGGTKRMRGYLEGRYRDKCMAMLQAEYRAHLFWRIGAVAFIGAGSVGESIRYDLFDYVRWTAGGGLRFQLDKIQQVNLRIDYGFGPKTSGFYVTVGEAF